MPLVKMRRVIAAALGLLALAGLGWFFLSPPTPSGPSAVETTDADASDSGRPAKTRRSVLEKVALPPSELKAPDPEKPFVPDPDAPRPFRMEVAEEPALSGLELETLGAGDRERLKVPDRFGSGVLVTKIHPDAPAAEAGLQPGDVIVRALREDVNEPGDLRKTVGQRKQTLLIASRDGQLMEVVILKPYDGS